MATSSTNSNTLASTTSTTASMYTIRTTHSMPLLSGSMIYYSFVHPPKASTSLNRKFHPNLKLLIRATLNSYLESRSSATAMPVKSISHRANSYARYLPAFGWRTHTLSLLPLKMPTISHLRQPITHLRTLHSTALPLAL